MFKRVIMLIALGAALVACSPAGGSSADPSVDAPVESPVRVVGGIAVGVLTGSQVFRERPVGPPTGRLPGRAFHVLVTRRAIVVVRRYVDTDNSDGIPGFRDGADPQQAGARPAHGERR